MVEPLSSDQCSRLQSIARRLRHHIVDMIGGDGLHTGHLGGSCSCADIVTALYFEHMRVFPQQPQHPQRDRFVLSKGHAALVQYAALAERGFFDPAQLQTVKRMGSMLQGHPDLLKTPGVEANTGSLGQGLSIGVGMALGLRLTKNIARVYVLLGDGELQEGQVWEAATAAANYALENLICIVDVNGLQATGETARYAGNADLGEKWRAFGWESVSIDGHSMPEIVQALAWATEAVDVPRVILARTVKGQGISFAENKVAFHNAALTQEQFRRAHLDLNIPLEEREVHYG